ncbi:MAG: Gfo/Idh/MocA family oxidoreductase [Chloroflexi bacterium]|nr:Gfo/Idh/MocA family oxidoreductase [Actinomycetota bacterium]MBA3739624.1 Gfo/Idh/MocA family oxidoreductase [Chloroflexota bacterium]
MPDSGAPVARGTTIEQRAVTRVGVIGMGRWGRELIRVFARAAEVVVCSNRGDSASIRWLAEAHPGTRHTTDVEAVFANPEIQAVVIATPIATHPELAVAALQSGKHVFVEKPLATSVEGCDSVIDAADRARRQLFVGHTFLYDAGLEHLHDRTRTDPINEMELVWHKFGTFEEPLVWNLLTHEVAITLWLVGSPSGAHIEEARPSQTSLDRLRVTLTFPGDRRISIEIDRTDKSREKTVMATTASGARYRWSQGVLDRLGADTAWRTVHVASTEALAREAQAFLASIVTGKRPLSDGSFGRLVTCVVAEVERRCAPGADQLPSTMRGS